MIRRLHLAVLALAVDVELHVYFSGEMRNLRVLVPLILSDHREPGLRGDLGDVAFQGFPSAEELLRVLVNRSRGSADGVVGPQWCGERGNAENAGDYAAPDVVPVARWCIHWR